MNITAIKAAVRTKGRCNIFVDGKYSFSLDELQLVGSGIFMGRELTEAELTNLKDESAFGKAYARALEYIMRRPRSVKELREYAWRKQWEPDLAKRVMERLKRKGYLDDAKFAEVWVRHRAMGRPISLRKLRAELMQKGITEGTINQALQGSDFNEQSALINLIAKKRKLARFQDDQKLMQYLAGKGFSFDDIRAAMAGDSNLS